MRILCSCAIRKLRLERKFRRGQAGDECKCVGDVGLCGAGGGEGPLYGRQRTRTRMQDAGAVAGWSCKQCTEVSVHGSLTQTLFKRKRRARAGGVNGLLR